MFLVLPVQTLLLYTTVGVSTYSLVSWLLSLHPFEMLLYTSLLSALTSVGCVLFLYTLLPTEESLDGIENRIAALEKNPVYCMECGGSFGISTDAEYASQHRVIVEKDGTLIITTTFSPAEKEVDAGDADDADEDGSVEEIRESLSKEEPLPSPVEETTEFSDLLDEKCRKKE